jgi:hypothetical protein
MPPEVSVGYMQSADTDQLHQLREGQLWKVEHGFIFIVELGRRLVHYKMLRRPGVRTAVTQMIRIEALLNYLCQSEAQLVATELLAVSSVARPIAAAA